LVVTNELNIKLNPDEHSEYEWVDLDEQSISKVAMSNETKKCLIDAAYVIERSRVKQPSFLEKETSKMNQKSSWCLMM
jgi:hypothetical protein